MTDYKAIYQTWLNSKELTSEQKTELIGIKDDDNEIKERFAAELQFGTAGMRGVLGMGPNRMNIFMVRRATVGLAAFVESLGEEAKKRGVVISYDTRRFSKKFAIECAKVLSAKKIASYLFEDVRPVPMCSFAVRETGAIAGIMITASHNPPAYNGYKVYGEDGAQMSPEATAEVVKFIKKTDVFGLEVADTLLTEDGIKGKDNFKADEYITVIGRSLDEKYFAAIEKLSLSPDAIKAANGKVKIVYTPVHGSGYMPVMTILKKIGIPVTVVPEQAEPDENFSTVRVPNPEESDTLKMAVELAEKIGSNVVIGTDPDCDRMGIAVRDDNGKFVLLTGNQIGVLMMDYVLSVKKAEGILPKNAAVVKTIVTTDLARKVAAGYGAKTFDVLTGFKFIGEKIKEWETSGEYTYEFGFEESYGSLVGTHARDKDAVVASMIFAEMACKYESEGTSVYDRLQEIFKKYGYYVEKGVSITFGGLDGFEKMTAIMQKIRSEIKTEFAGEKVESFSDYVLGVTTFAGGRTESISLPKTNAAFYRMANGDWMCVRPSGTEPKLKIYVSTSRPTLDESQKAGENLLLSIKNTFGI